MEFINFTMEKKRLCDAHPSCGNCPMREARKKTLLQFCHAFIFTYPSEAEEIVEKWAKENPVETRLTKFLKEYPDTEMLEYNKVPAICVKRLGYKVENCSGTTCEKCWGKEV